MENTRRLLIQSGSVLLFLGVLTGLFVGAAMTGQVAADGRMALASHLNAILGAFVLFGLALSLPLLRYREGTLAGLAWTLIVANYANWLVTAVKAGLHVHGIALTGKTGNDTIFMLLTLLVVLPSLAGGLVWVIGFRKIGKGLGTAP